jgi:hypothetical protein
MSGWFYGESSNRRYRRGGDGKADVNVGSLWHAAAQENPPKMMMSSPLGGSKLDVDTVVPESLIATDVIVIRSIEQVFDQQEESIALAA